MKLLDLRLKYQISLIIDSYCLANICDKNATNVHFGVLFVLRVPLIQKVEWSAGSSEDNLPLQTSQTENNKRCLIDQYTQIIEPDRRLSTVGWGTIDVGIRLNKVKLSTVVYSGR